MKLRIESTEYLYVPVYGATGLGSYTVRMALLQKNVHPTDDDWVAAAWTGSDSLGWKAKVLVGPDGDQTIASAGIYYPWVRITASPEDVVMVADSPVNIV